MAIKAATNDGPESRARLVAHNLARHGIKGKGGGGSDDEGSSGAPPPAADGGPAAPAGPAGVEARPSYAGVIWSSARAVYDDDLKVAGSNAQVAPMILPGAATYSPMILGARSAVSIPAII